MLEAYWTQPQIHHMNAQEPNAYFIPNKYAGQSRESSDRLLLLDGMWNFAYYPSVEEVDWSTVAKQRQYPHTIKVPGHWQTQGFDQAQYITSPYPFLYDPPYVPAENPAGVYMRTFEITKRDDSRMFLHFEGVDSCGVYFLNDVFIGYSEGPHNSVAFDVSDQVLEGENTLVVVVLKWCSGSYLDDQDKLRMTGIFREVYLLSRPQTHIRDFFVRPDLHGLQLDLTITNPRENVRLLLYDLAKCLIFSTCLPAVSEMQYRIDIPNPVLWNAEQPHLYTLRIELAEEWIEQRVGLRTVGIQDGKLLINGQPVKLWGVNRHENDPNTGYVVSPAAMRRDLEMMKRFNINCVRTSHYPNDPRFYELCDELGLYVIDEADMETHGCCYVGDSDLIVNHPDYVSPIMDREHRLLERNKNFSSIIIWSMGNESGWGKNLVYAAQWMRQRDPSRLLNMESAFSAQRRRSKAACCAEVGSELIDLLGIMYPTEKQIEELLAIPDEGRPVLLIEYCHAMGNSLGDVSIYTDAFLRNDRLMGGCIWEWSDHGLCAPDGTFLYGGDFGDQKNNGNLCADGLVSPDRIPHSSLYELKEAYSPIRFHYEHGVLTIRNCYSFTDTSDLDLLCTVLHNGRTAASCLLQWPIIQPLDSVQMIPELPPMQHPGEWVMLLQVLQRGNPAADPICQWSHLLSNASYEPCAGNLPLQCTYRHGMLHQVAAFEQQIVQAVKPVIWRAPLDNDRRIRTVWTNADAGENIHIPVYNVHATEQTGDSLAVRFVLGGMSYRPVVEAEIQWKSMNGQGLKISHSAKVRSDYPSWLPRYGLQWTIDKRFHHVTYYGYGPHETYVDKHLSARPGIWHYDALRRPHVYVRPQESGSHWHTYFVTLTDDSGHGIILYSAQPFSFNVQTWTPEELTDAKHPADLPVPQMLTLNTDLRMSGVGSASVGPELPTHRRIQPGDALNHTLYLSAFDRECDDPFSFLL